MKVNAASKTRLIVPKPLEPTLFQYFGCQRFIYNKALEQRIEFYEDTGKTLSYNAQSATLKAWKEEFPWLKDAPAPSLQQTLLHLDQGYKNFFTGTANKPTFKKKFKSAASVSFPQASHFSIQRLNRKYGEVDLPKLGKLRFYWLTNHPDEIKSCVVSHDGKNFHISFQGYKHLTKTADPFKPIGIDMGINVSAATSKPVADTDSQLFYLDVKKIKSLENRIANKQRLQATKTRRSHRWCKLQNQIKTLHRKIRNIRQEFAHQLTAKIAKNHGLVFVEDLDVKHMMESASGTKENPGTDVAKKSGLNRAIGRQGWGGFRTFLIYKVGWYGDGIFPQNPAYSSQKCSRCKYVSEENRDTGTIGFHCQRCGFVAHADVNAATNLEEDGLASLVAKYGSITTTPSALRNSDKTRILGKRSSLGASRRKPSSNLPTRGQASNGNKAGKNSGSSGDSTKNE